MSLSLRRYTFLGYVPNTMKQWRQWDGCQQEIVICLNVRFDKNGIGNRRPADPKMLEEISGDQTDQQSTPAPSRGWPVVETLLRGAATPPPMPATSPPASGQNSQPSEEAPERQLNSLLMSLSPSTRYLNLITPASRWSEVGYEDIIMLVPTAGANTVTGEPARAGSALTKISMAFAARSDNEPQSYKEAMANSTKWHAAIKSKVDSHIENGTWEAGKLPPGRREISSQWVFKTNVNVDGSLRYKARLVVHGFEKREVQDN